MSLRALYVAPPFFLLFLPMYDRLPPHPLAVGSDADRVCFSELTPDFAIQFAKALGAKVIVFSHSPNKESDAKKLGADEFVVTANEDFAKPYFDKLDYILSAADAAKLPISDLVTTLKVDGKFTSVGLPDEPWTDLHPAKLVTSAASVGATHIGSKKEA